MNLKSAAKKILLQKIIQNGHVHANVMCSFLSFHGGIPYHITSEAIDDLIKNRVITEDENQNLRLAKQK